MRPDLIAPSAERSGATVEEVLQSIATGQCIYMEGPGSVMVHQIIRDHEGLSLNAWIVGGDLPEVLSLLPGAEALARGMGCAFTSFGTGRPGWSRVLKAHGYAWNGVEFRKAM